MQMAIIEFARNQLNIKKATSSEFGSNGTPIIGLINEWNKDGKKIKGTDKDLGGTMRLGAWDCEILKNTISHKVYKKKLISERHRHRYEFNNEYSKKIFDDKFIVAGFNPDTKLVEIIENIDHPWFVGVQFHPEYKSTVSTPHPLFKSFVKASLAKK